MSRYLLFYDERFALHRPPYGTHPENPGRLKKALRAIVEAGLEPYWAIVQPAALRGMERRHILAVHDEAYVLEVEKLAERGGGYLDPDTYVGAYTVEAAHAYVAHLLNGVDMLAEGEADVIMVLGRPPGHHAGRAGAAMGAPTLGFCVFNISAIAAKYAEAITGGPILVVDFDLHHGNGTQEILYRERNIVHLDLHQDPSTIYPGTGWPWEYGAGDAKGTKLNVLVPPDAGDDVYLSLFHRGLELALSVLGSHPTMVIVDAGFDGYAGDGLGLLNLTTNTYYEIGASLRKLGVPVLVVFEGGYSLGLERGLPAFMAGLAGLANPVKEEASESRSSVWKEAMEYFERLVDAVRSAGKIV